MQERKHYRGSFGYQGWEEPYLALERDFLSLISGFLLSISFAFEFYFPSRIVYTGLKELMTILTLGAAGF